VVGKVCLEGEEQAVSARSSTKKNKPFLI